MNADELARLQEIKERLELNYRCIVCGATGVKLWRYSYAFVEKHGLRCAKCASADQQKDISTMRQDGRYLGTFGWTDQIGWYIPAVPTEDGNYWGYTTPPQDAIDWWSELPNEL